MRPLFIPNSLFLSVSIENPSRMHNRRINATIGLRYDDASKVEKIVLDIREMLSNHPEIDQNQISIVTLENLAPFSLELLLYTFTKATERVAFQQVQQDVFLKVLKIIELNGAKCPFPTTSIDFSNELTLNSKIYRT